MWLFFNLTLACVHYDTTVRPEMHNVVSMPTSIFCKDFEYGKELVNVASNLIRTFITTHVNENF
jgi:hypothetical protein